MLKFFSLDALYIIKTSNCSLTAPNMVNFRKLFGKFNNYYFSLKSLYFIRVFEIPRPFTENFKYIFSKILILADY